MNVRDFECRSYEQALGYLRGRTTKHIVNNTVLQKWNNGTIGLYLHGHGIVSMFPDGRVQLWSCGFRTATTKDRINRCLPGPWRLAQRGGNWHLWRIASLKYDRQSVEEVAFVDGMTVPGTEVEG